MAREGWDMPQLNGAGRMRTASAGQNAEKIGPFEHLSMGLLYLRHFCENSA